MALGIGSGLHSGFVNEQCNYALMTWNQNAAQNGGWKVENVWDSGTAREVGDTIDIKTKIYLSGLLGNGLSFFTSGNRLLSSPSFGS